MDSESNTTKKKKITEKLLFQVSILFIIGCLTAGLVTFLTQKGRSSRAIQDQIEDMAAETGEEVRLAIREFPASNWLMKYWYQHSDEMDIEYDVNYNKNTRTYHKSVQFAKRYPGISMRYVDEYQLNEMPEEDQKLYAEIVYSWMITRLNEIKRTYKMDFLFVFITDENCETQFFLLSAAEPGMMRGTEYLQVYPLGVSVNVSETQRDGMLSARKNKTYLAQAGNYVDYYALIGSLDGRSVMIGLTYNTSGLSSAIKESTAKQTGFAVIHQVGLSLIFLTLIIFFLLRPLRDIQKNIRLYKETKNSIPVVRNLSGIRSKNEIGDLAQDVADLTTEMDDYMDRVRVITAEKERIGVELSLATRIQESMLPNTFPPFPERTEFDIYASMDPAKEVGGDFYDFFFVDEDHLCLSIADVSGKGIPAALFMMASKIILANNAQMGKSPAQILTDTNAMIASNNKEDMFVTVWLGILEISTGKLSAANAGHEYPVLGRPDGEFRYYKDKHGFVIGGMPGLKYKEYELQLNPGDRLFVYTDGLPEATDAEGNMFGADRVLEALNEKKEATPEQILAQMRTAVDGFVKDAEQFDDLTMLCLEYRGKNNG